MVDKVGIAFSQGSDGCIFCVPAATFEPLKDQHAVTLVLADASANGLQRFAKGACGFSLAFPGVDLDGSLGISRLTIGTRLGTAMGAHFGMQIGHLHQGPRCSTASDDDFHALRPGLEAAHNIFDIE